jgi:hypothetical protein
MAERVTLRVEGYRQFMRAMTKADNRQRRALREKLRRAGSAVQTDAARRLASKDPRSAAGYRTRVLQRGIIVAQSITKTTGAHPEWGSYQMRHALLPALYENAAETERALELALDQICDDFNRGG